MFVLVCSSRKCVCLFLCGVCCVSSKLSLMLSLPGDDVLCWLLSCTLSSVCFPFSPKLLPVCFGLVPVYLVATAGFVADQLM